jgi:hypothetical protein
MALYLRSARAGGGKVRIGFDAADARGIAAERAITAGGYGAPAKGSGAAVERDELPADVTTVE